MSGGNGLDKDEEVLMSTFREIRETGRHAAEWRTLAKFASAKARAEEEEYEHRFMKTIPGQQELRIRLFDDEVLSRLQVLERKRLGLPRLKFAGVPSSALGYQVFMKGLDAMEQEYGLTKKATED